MSADDDNLPSSLKRRYQVCDGCRPVHDFAPPLVPSSRSTKTYGTGCSRSQNTKPLRIIGVGIVHKGFLAAQFEDIRCEKYALRIAKALIQIYNNSHSRHSSDELLSI